MSYPSIGMEEILQPGEVWNAAKIEQVLRYGGHIFFEDKEDGNKRYGHVEWFAGNLHQAPGFAFVNESGKVVHSAEDFHEFAVWIAFFGRDFL